MHRVEIVSLNGSEGHLDEDTLNAEAAVVDGWLRLGQATEGSNK